MEVVGCIREPLRNELVLGFVQIDGNHLPVGLVVVDAVEPRAPVVVGEEEPVLADGPAAVAHNAPVVHVALVLLEERRVLELRRRCGRAGHAPPEEQGRGEERVAEAGQQAAAREPPHARAELALLPLFQPAGVRERLRALAEAEPSDESEVEERAEGRRTRFDQLFDGQVALGYYLLVVVVRVIQPQAAGAHVRLDVHREELLTAREANDRLERPQDLEVSRGRGDSELVG
ncbi:MAG: hypothetical protein ACRDMY_07180 [Gaiellaceae bacterium]